MPAEMHDKPDQPVQPIPRISPLPNPLQIHQRNQQINDDRPTQPNQKPKFLGDNQPTQQIPTMNEHTRNIRIDGNRAFMVAVVFIVLIVSALIFTMCAIWASDDVVKIIDAIQD